MKILNWMVLKGSSLSGRSGSFPHRSLFKGRHVKASSESGAGPWPLEESTKECVRPGEMSDKLLGWSLKRVFSSSPTLR